jgi:hypothetical protein
MGLLMQATRPLSPLFAQPAAMGALPQLRATVDPGARGNDYYGPAGFRELRGFPVKVDRSDRAKDDAVAGRLWEASVALTGEDYGELS